MTQTPNSEARKGIMWASSHMGPRGFCISLPQIAAKEDYIRGRSIITCAIVNEYCATVERVKAKHGTLPPLEGRVTA